MSTETATGAGSELKRVLAGWPFYLVAEPDCTCHAMAARMDEMGCDWCASDEGIDEILATLRENAAKRGLPYMEAAARMLVKRAISTARAKLNQPRPVV